MLKELFKNVREEKARFKKVTGDDIASLCIALFERGIVYNLDKEELKVLLQEAIYLLREKDRNAEDELMQAVEEWHPELFEDEATIKELIKMYEGRVFIEADCQEWEAVEGVDYTSVEDVVNYEVKEDLNGNQYALIKK